MCVYKPEDKALYKEYKRLEKMWKERSAEIVEDMILSGVDRVYSDDGLEYMKLVHMPDMEVKSHTKPGFDYVRFYWFQYPLFSFE